MRRILGLRNQAFPYRSIVFGRNGSSLARLILFFWTVGSVFLGFRFYGKLPGQFAVAASFPLIFLISISLSRTKIRYRIKSLVTMVACLIGLELYPFFQAEFSPWAIAQSVIAILFVIYWIGSSVLTTVNREWHGPASTERESLYWFVADLVIGAILRFLLRETWPVVYPLEYFVFGLVLWYSSYAASCGASLGMSKFEAAREFVEFLMLVFTAFAVLPIFGSQFQLAGTVVLIILTGAAVAAEHEQG